METVTMATLKVYLILVLATMMTKLMVNANTGYMVVTPSVFRPGAEEVISVTILKPSAPIHVEAKLFSPDGSLATEAAHELFGKGTLKLKVPHDTKGKCRLKICGKSRGRPSENPFSFCNSTIIPVKEKGASAFIQTDKPIYKPSQTVRINIITVGPDLKPVNGNVSVYVMDPRETRMIHWENVSPTCCGIKKLSYPLSEQPMIGRWTIETVYQGHVYNRSFEVMKYVLPKFDVAIYPPNFIRNWDSCETVFVKARYTYDKAVNGKLDLSMYVKGVDYYKQYKSDPVGRYMKVKQGVAYFNVCMSDMVKQVPSHFRGVLHIEAEVVTDDGAKVKVRDASCPVHKHLVDINFTKDTKRHFKPGLPYKGRISVFYPDGSPADNVTITVRSDITGYRSISSDIVSSQGVAEFEVPAIPAEAQALRLEAKVVKIGSELQSSHYFSIFMSVHGWYSPSNCHVLVESYKGKYRVGDEAKFTVHSTCPCNFTMYVEVMSRGNLVHSGLHIGSHLFKRAAELDDPLNVSYEYETVEGHGSSNQQNQRGTCKVKIRFQVRPEMAPSSRLLVYYVRPNGEGVADTLMFDVTPQFINRLSLDLSKREALPGEEIEMKVNTKPGSCVCIGAVDKSVHLMRPGFQLTSQDVFDELENYDITIENDEEHDHHIWALSGVRRRKRSAPWWHVKDAQHAFNKFGVTVLTDSVKLNFKPEASNEGPIYRPDPEYEEAALLSSSKSFQLQYKRSARKRSFFPETWLWECFNTSTTRSTETHKITVPDSITSWAFDGVSLSEKHGMAVADQIDIKTFKQFFLDFYLPYSVIRGEQVKIPLTVHNYLHTCVEVHLKLNLPRGASIIPRVDMIDGVKFCIGTEERKVLSYIMVFSKLGSQKVTAVARAYAESRCCAGVIYNDEVNEENLIGEDHVEVDVRTEAEGIPREYTHSVYFCPNERIHLSTPNKYEFQYLKKPENMRGFSFAARASNDVRISLSALPSDNEDMYEIVIGGWFNTESWIALGKDGTKLANATTTNILSEHEYRPFWITWFDGKIRMGAGEKFSNETEILTYNVSNRPLFIQYIGFSTGWGASGEFKIWTKRELSSTGFGEVFQLMLPPNVIIGSEWAVAKAMGDVMGPSLHNFKHLLRLPHGCGEQNMARFAPNVFVLLYLSRTGQLTEEVKQQSLTWLVEGYQRQLSYKRDDGSYSAFGERDSSGNMWLTAFVVRSFAKARSFIYVDPDELSSSIMWILEQQRPDGSFPATGRLFNKEIQGGLPGRIALTAYVATALLDVGISEHEKLERLAIRRARRYVENNLDLVEDSYTAALVGYALTRLRSNKAGQMWKQLNNLAIKRDGLTYWKFRGFDRGEDFEFLNNDDPADQEISAAEIEIAGYALLALTYRGDIASSLPVVKWLSLKRNALGGFSSTQDTVVALHALSEYAARTYTGKLNLTVTVESTNMDLQEKFSLNPGNSGVEQSTRIPSLPAGLFVSAVGDGCGLLQVEVHYNVPDPHRVQSFDLHVRLGKQRRPLEKNKTRKARGADGLSSAVEISHHMEAIDHFIVTLETCMMWKHQASSNMAVLEVSMLTGFKADLQSLENLLKHRHLKLKRYEIEGRKIIFYFDEIRSNCLTCISFDATREFVVGKTHPVPVRVYDYYDPVYEASVFYNASHIGELIQDLCDDKECNEIKEDVPQPELEEDCNDIFGCYELSRDVEFCTCYRECSLEGVGGSVCASDSNTYPSRCHMEVEACERDLHLEVMPETYCNVEELESYSGEDYDSFWTTSLYHYNNATTVAMVTIAPDAEQMTEMFHYEQDAVTTAMTFDNSTAAHSVELSTDSPDYNVTDDYFKSQNNMTSSSEEHDTTTGDSDSFLNSTDAYDFTTESEDGNQTFELTDDGSQSVGMTTETYDATEEVTKAWNGTQEPNLDPQIPEIHVMLADDSNNNTTQDVKQEQDNPLHDHPHRHNHGNRERHHHRKHHHHHHDHHHDDNVPDDVLISNVTNSTETRDSRVDVESLLLEQKEGAENATPKESEEVELGEKLKQDKEAQEGWSPIAHFHLKVVDEGQTLNNSTDAEDWRGSEIDDSL